MKQSQPLGLEHPYGDDGQKQQGHDQQQRGAVERVDLLRARVADVQLNVGQRKEARVVGGIV